jgi:4-hydroxy-tetrahydrodipicolinate reductase
MIRVCVAGATGWTGRAVAEAVAAADDLELVSAVARSTAGSDLGEALGQAAMGVPVLASVADAAPDADVVVDYTSDAAVKGHALAAIAAGAAVVVGSSGLSARDHDEIDAAARSRGVGVVAAGNFSLTAAMAQAAVSLVAPHLPQAEVIDYASAGKADAPSGTARELAERLAAAREPVRERDPVDTSGSPEARGADIAGVSVHSLRLPSFTVSTEVVFGLPDERLAIRHDAGASAAPYVAGTLLAVRAVVGRVGLTRGLDTLLLEAST